MTRPSAGRHERGSEAPRDASDASGTSAHPLRLARLAWDARAALRGGRAAVDRRQRVRLAEAVAHARAHSPYYRELYRGLPARVEDPTLLPVTSKRALMARYDDWVTDRAVTAGQVRAFVERPELIGEPFLGRYTVATTSGTTGTPGHFLVDARSFAVTKALALRMLGAWLGVRDVVRLIAGGGRMAMVMATGGHYASAAAAVRLRTGSPRRARSVLALSAHTPLAALVERLNAFRPVIVAPYASVAVLLAGEQEAGRLRIAPVLLALSAEGLPEAEYDRIARAFDATVGNSYAATECPFLSYGCRERWLHVNSDWVALEPVDADYRPVPPGTPSHTVLLSNLANRAQPILRYDLGDSVLQRPDACPCGNPLPAVRVRGRAADMMTCVAQSGERVAVPPLAFEVNHVPGVELLQVVQRTPSAVRVRVRPSAGADPARVWDAVRAELARLFAAHGLEDVVIERAHEPPEQSAGGKYRSVIPLDPHMDARPVDAAAWRGRS